MFRATTICSLLCLVLVTISNVEARAASNRKAIDANSPVRIVQLKKEASAPKYPAEFRMYWNDEGFVRGFEGTFESECGITLNAAQKKYIRTVILPEVRDLAYNCYLTHGRDLNVLMSRTDKHFQRHAARYVGGILQRADAEHTEQIMSCHPPSPVEETEEFEAAPAPAF
jgi:hypothetical protein